MASPPSNAMTTAAWLLVICTIICLVGSVVAVPTLEKFAPPVSGGQSGGLQPIVKGPANVQGLSPLGAPIVGAVDQKNGVKVDSIQATPGFSDLMPTVASAYATCLTVKIFGANLYTNQPTKVRMYEVGRNLPYPGWQATRFTVTQGVGQDLVQADFALTGKRFRLDAAAGAADYVTTSVSSSVATTTTGLRTFRIQLFRPGLSLSASSSVCTVSATIKTYPAPIINWVSPYTAVNTSRSARENFTVQIGGSGFYENPLVILSTSTSLSTVVTRNVTATSLSNYLKKPGTYVNVGSNITTQMNLSYYWNPVSSTVTPLATTTNRPMTSGFVGSTTLFPAGIYYFGIVNPKELVIPPGTGTPSIQYPVSDDLVAGGVDGLPNEDGNVIFYGEWPTVIGSRGAFIFGQDKAKAAGDVNARTRFNLTQQHTLLKIDPNYAYNSTAADTSITINGVSLPLNAKVDIDKILRGNPKDYTNNSTVITNAAQTSLSTAFNFLNGWAGMYTVKVTNLSDGSYNWLSDVNGGNVSGSLGTQTPYFNIAEGPHVASITPASGVTGTKDLIIGIIGSGFVGTWPTSLNSYLKKGTTTIASTSVTRSGTSSLNAVFNLSGATAGTYAVSVWDSDMTAPETKDFNVTDGPAPLLSSISPITGVNTSTNVNVTLSGFYFRTGAKVTMTKGSTTITNSTATTTTGTTETTLTTAFNLSGATAGTYNVAVINTDGQGTVSPVTFAVTAPSGGGAVTIRLNSPTKVNKTFGAATGYTMKITGTNLKAGSVFNIRDVNPAHSNRDKGSWTLPYVNKDATFIKTDVNAFKPNSSFNSAVYNVTITSTDGTSATRAWGLSITSV